MSNNGSVVKMSIRGAPVGEQRNRLYAFLIEEDEAAQWVVTPDGDGFRFAMRGTDYVITAPDEGEEPAQAAVRPDQTARSCWQLERLDEDGSGRPATQIESGFYRIRQNDRVLGRSRREDLSLMPKGVYVEGVLPEDRWVIEVVR
jgi:hypothetical protein